MALVLKGAMLAKREGNSIQCRYMCEKCGHIEGTIRVVTARDQGRFPFASFSCYNCGHLQQVEIRE